MKTLFSGLALAAALAGAAAAQPSNTPDAKGNAPLKPGHTVNDGSARAGRNSFTEGQARQHIEKAGFTGVTALVKGPDGVWRGQGMRNGEMTDVAMDFKGNVSTASIPGQAMASSRSTTTTTSTMTPPPAAAAAPMAATSTATTMHHHRRRHRHRRHMAHCANPGPNGAACSGVDRNRNGVSDREDHAIQNGARP